MLQTQQQPYDHFHVEEDEAPSISPSYVFEVLRRRALWFLLPFVVVLALGSAAAVLWPASYLSEGTILVLSPEIPSDLVRPTVSTAANERMQVIEQRIMTRDNLLAIAKKYHISAGWRDLVSGTQLVDFIRKRAVIEPVEMTRRNRHKDAIAFKVGFNYENPTIAMKVANEFVTLILKEDVRARTSYATETTKFLARDVERIQDQLSLLDSQIAEIKQRIADSGGNLATKDAQTDGMKALAALKQQLAIKSATLSSQHPDIIALKRKIKALEKADASDQAAIKSGVAGSAKTGAAAAGGQATVAKGSAAALGLDTLETRRKSLKDELNNATQKLAAARLGESLERGQHSERLEVIEQPTYPDKPVSPNRPKLFVAAFAAALMAGGGLMVAREMADQSVRRSTDVAALIDSYLVVSVPYITTRREIGRKRMKLIFWLVFILAIVVGGSIAAYYFLPPPDILYDKLVNKVMNLLLK